MTRRAMLSRNWKRCTCRRSASVSCAGAEVVTLLLTLLGRIGRHREDPSPGECDAYAVLNVGRDRPVERPKEVARDRAVLGREDFRRAEPNVGLDGREVLEDAPAEETHGVPRVVQVHAAQPGRDREEHWCVGEPQAHEQRDRCREVTESVDPAREERSRPRPDRRDDLAVDELAGGTMDRWDHDPLAELDRDSGHEGQNQARPGGRAEGGEAPDWKAGEHPRDAEPPEAHARHTGMDE